MAQSDIQEMVRFTREFVLMSLVPWMEKCTLEWNENVGSLLNTDATLTFPSH